MCNIVYKLRGHKLFEKDHKSFQTLRQILSSVKKEGRLQNLHFLPDSGGIIVFNCLFYVEPTEFQTHVTLKVWLIFWVGCHKTKHIDKNS